MSDISDIKNHAASETLQSGAFLPREQPLSMPAQDFGDRRACIGMRAAPSVVISRAVLFSAATLLTAGFAYELYAVLAFVRITPLQIVFLILCTLAFGWIALGSLSAAMGFLPLFAGERADSLVLPPANGVLTQRTALLFPVYHEDPARIAGTIEAIAAEIEAHGRTRSFDVFVLSDTRGEAAGRVEEKVYLALARHLRSVVPVYYRRRSENTGKKAGNIEDWIRRFGGGYSAFVILDADSVLSGELLIRLALAMQGHPSAGLIQTIPRLAGGTTLFQRLQQFAANVYGPAVAAGLAAWHGTQGNYWGHNAIVRTAAFAAAAGLPELPGRPPFGGHIQSHDFVEAALLQRAGWHVVMVPTAAGSYEGSPPGVIDLVRRDRRWAQGNLQHVPLLAAPGLTAIGRVHLAMGAASYIVSAVWAASLTVGIVLALQGQHLIPSYFRDSRTLFPIWPIIDPGDAFRLFLATLSVVLLPKALGLVLEIKRAHTAWEMWGALRAVAGVLIETVFSMLLAPILMATQTAAVVQILAGRDSGWSRQQRDDGGRVTWENLLRFHWWHMLAGLAAACLCALVSLDLMAWMAPVLLGLVLAAPLTWFTARRAGPVLAAILSTPEDRSPPAILTRAAACTRTWMQRIAGGSLDEPPVRPPLHRLPQAA